MRERMKLIFVVMAWLTLFTSLPCQAQDNDVRLSMTFKNEPLTNAFVRLEKSSSYKFLFTYDDVNKYTVTGSVKDAKFFDIVRFVLKDKPLDYSVNGKFINVFKKDANRTQNDGKLKTYGGYVYEEKTKQPIIGAQVKLLGTQIVTVTGLDGSFSFDWMIPDANNKVQVSYMGMKTATVSLASNMKIYMKEDSKVLDDVVITGMFKKSRESYTGAVSTITSDELKTYRGQNLLQTLKNIDASINFQANNLVGSNPNNLPSINIRGNASIPTNLKEFNETQQNTVNTPLIIMDGFEITLEKLMDYNDDEIESINILKDASATAIYGSRGANGVIVVVSKEPEAGKLRINAEAGLTIEVPDLSSYDLLNAAEKLQLEKTIGIYSDTDPSVQVNCDKVYNRRLKAVLAGTDTDWLSKPLRNGIGQRYSLRLEGGSNEFRWSASALLNNVEGAMKGSSRNTFTGGITLMYRIKNLTFRNYTSITVNNSEESKYGSFSDYVKMNPYESPYDENGNLVSSYRWDEYHSPYAGNPLYDASLGSFDKSGYKDITNNFSIEWTPFTGFIARGQVGITSTTNTSDTFTSPFDSKYDDDEYQSGSGLFRKGEYVYGSGDSYTLNAEVTASYTKTFAEKHQLYAGLDWSLAQSHSKMYYFDLEGFATDDISDLTTAQQYAENGTPTGTNSYYRRVGLTGNLNYTYDNRYYLDASYRVDGNSNFGSNKKWAPFYSVGIGWNMHNEKFFKDLFNDKLNMLRLRMSYGETGTQLSSSSGANSLYEYVTDNRYLNWMGASLKNLGNPDLTWQKTDEFNVGIEFGVLNNRIKGSFDYYTKKTSNLLSYMDLPLSMGFSSYTANVGAVKNNGFEAMLQGYILRNTKKDLFWIVSGQLMYNKNKITELSADIEAQNEAYLAEGVEVANLMQVGRPQNAIYGVRSLGIDPSTGNEIFLDKNGNITSVWSAKDVVYLGQTDPKYRGILSSMFNYKGWSLNVSFAYHWGGQMYNSTLRDRVEVTKDVIQKENVDRRVLENRWLQAGDVTFFKKISTNETKATSRYVMDDNVLELQSVSLQYKWTGESLRRILPLQSVIFAINANDLFYWSSVRVERGTDYPFARNIQASMKVMF